MFEVKFEDFRENTFFVNAISFTKKVQVLRSRVVVEHFF